ncbi:hypothetical protein [Mycolicibacterium thermoresistibile]
MWCPSVSLSVWTNSWLAGAAAPDDVLDALSLWAPAHSVTAYDSVAAGRTGLPWPDLDNAGAVSLLQTVRSAAGSPVGAPPLRVVLPIPGDVRGLPAGTQFQQDGIAVGEAVIVSGEAAPDAAVGLVPEFEYADVDDDDEALPTALSWTVYSLPAVPPAEHIELGEAEYGLRSAVRSAAHALDALQVSAAGTDIDDPREVVEQIIESQHLHRVPEHAPRRALRVLETAAHVDAIIAVSSGLMPIGLQSSSEVQLAGDALRPLGQVVRTARMAAVSAIIQSAW